MNDADVEGRIRSEVGRLTRLPASEFVAARTARAKELKADDEAELARLLAAQRRPTVPAWAADQLAHRHADDLAALFDAADRVRRSQTAATPDRRAVREASTAFTAQVRRLRALAGDRLAEAGTTPDAHLDEVEATLLAAATDERIAADLRGGALLRPAPSPGFAALASLSSADGPTPRPAPDVASASRTVDRADEPISDPPEIDEEAEAEAQRAAEAELRAIQARRDELRTRHVTCVAEERRAADRAAAATSRAEGLRAEAERLLQDAAAAEEEASSAERDAREARGAAAELAEELAAFDTQGSEVAAPTS